jgi:apolipoprotein D and lipocalin family protein
MKIKQIIDAAMAMGASALTKTTTERLELPPLEPVLHVDLGRYLGTWYEISSYPQPFQKGCTHTKATYSLGRDGLIDVVNECCKDGKEKVARGRARVVDRDTNAKLEVSFFGPFWGDYWIIDLGSDYEYAVVGHPSRDYLWILSRTPTMDEQTYEGILSRLREKGYPLDRLVKTDQSPST